MTTTALIDKDQLTPAARKSMYLSHFTPSMMPVETLEQLLVKRASLIERIVKSAVESVKTKGLHHHLFVGPRGIGKTHLISLLFHRLSAHKTIQSKGKLVWMREEEWGVTSFFELVLRILRNLDLSEPSLGLKAQMEELYELKPSQAEAAASHMLLQVVKDKTLIILLENLDDLFEQMGDSGQQKWRAFIQNNPQFVMIATTPALFKGVTSQKAAFYGSFDVEALDELSFDEVVELLEKIAEFRGDQELVDYIKTPEGRARIRAVHHLAEGNPRIYIIFAQFLSKVALAELVQAFMHTLDELTPYYQARMKERSSQQRKILDFLVKYRGAVPVKDIAKACFISQQVCSVQLKVLREAKFVRTEEIGRMSYYELREPLMRLCMEVKEQRGKPLSLFVDILRIWHSQDELGVMLRSTDSRQDTYQQYIQVALEKAKDYDPKLNAIINDMRKIIPTGNFSKAWILCEELLTLYPEFLEREELAFLISVSFSEASVPSLKSASPALMSRIIGMLINNDWGQIFKNIHPLKTNLALLRISQKLFSINEKYFENFTTNLLKRLLTSPAHFALALIWTSSDYEVNSDLTRWLNAFAELGRESHSFTMLPALQQTLEIHRALLSGEETQYLSLPVEVRKLIKYFGFYQVLENTKKKKSIND